MPVTTRARCTDDLTAVSTRRRRRRAGMNADEIAVVGIEEAARIRAVRKRRNDDCRAAERSENTMRMRGARAQRTDEKKRHK